MPAASVRTITVEDLAKKLKSEDQFILLDVREPWELDLARLADTRVHACSMSRLAREGLNALPMVASSGLRAD